MTQLGATDRDPGERIDATTYQEKDVRNGQSRRPPGPASAPLVPGHLGAPSYEECAGMLFLIGLNDATGCGLPPAIAFKIGPWERRLREWGRGEIERGNLDRLTGAMRGER